jgi:hypothetical protein
MCWNASEFSPWSLFETSAGEHSTCEMYSHDALLYFGFTSWGGEDCNSPDSRQTSQTLAAYLEGKRHACCNGGITKCEFNQLPTAAVCLDGDDEAALLEDSEGRIQSCAVGKEAGWCTNETDLTAMGAPSGWFTTRCCATCGIGGGGDADCCACKEPEEPKTCEDTPSWSNGQGATCETYKEENWCVSGIAGFGVAEDWTAGILFGYPEQNCCICGGGRGADATCEDTKGWENSVGLGCQGYIADKFCARGAILEPWAVGPDWGSPEDNCCACGKQ